MVVLKALHNFMMHSELYVESNAQVHATSCKLQMVFTMKIGHFFLQGQITKMSREMPQSQYKKVMIISSQLMRVMLKVAY